MNKMLTLATACFALFSCGAASNSSGFVDRTKVSNSDQNLLLDRVQKDVLKYFWDFAEPNSYLARERYHEDQIYPQNDAHVITTGGSGFGLATILVGVERGFVSRKAAVQRLSVMMDFLARADRYKGAWSHWIHGETGKTVPFGKKDNGGDLVETAFLTSGILMVREYFKNGTAEERTLAKKCDELWKSIQWNFYTKGGEKVLYWHWSPQYQWEMNFPLQGYNECLMTYILAASSPTYSIDSETYIKGWTRNRTYTTNNSAYGMPMFVKHNGAEKYGGPLFWAHYSYVGLDPRGLSDELVSDYFALNKNHTRINYQYCTENPLGWNGYSEKYWGLTASYTRNKDGSTGYNAHFPENDHGIVTPTAALSSFPYTPDESFKVLQFLYQEKPNFIGTAGPYDATSLHYNWTTPRYLAIDQGTIAPMIENYRTGFLWNLFMNAPEIRTGLKKLGFKSTQHKIR